MKMEFTFEDYQKKADEYILSKYGTLNVLKNDDVLLRDKLKSHMHKVVVQYNQEKDAMEIIKMNNDMFKHYINRHFEA